MWGILLLFLCAISTIQSSSSAIKPCDRDDKACLIKVVDKLYQEIMTGDPALKIDALDPSYFEEVDGDIATLKYKLVNTTIKGFKNCLVSDFSVPEDINTMHLELNCPFLDARGFYEIDGKILTFPIEGKGDYVMEFKDYHIVFDSELKVNENDGKKFLSITEYKYSAHLKSGKVDLKNLFNGKNNELADTVLKVMNENWSTLVTELQGPVFKANLVKIVKNFNKLFKLRDISTLIA